MVSASTLARGTIYLCRIKLHPRRVSKIVFGLSRPGACRVQAGSTGWRRMVRSFSGALRRGSPR
jgi:hypothetical protein